MTQRKRWIAIILGLLVTVLCMWLAVRGISFGEIRKSFVQADYRMLPVLLLLLFAFYWIKAIRWKMLLKPQKQFKTIEVFPAMMIGFMGNNILPAHLGEFMRMIVFAQQKNLSRTAVFSTLVLERIFDVIAILFFLGIGVAFLPNLPQELQSLTIGAGIATLLLIVGATLYIVWTRWFIAIIESLLKAIRIIPGGLIAKVVEMLRLGEVGLAALKDPRLTAGIVATSFAQWFVMGIMIDVALRSFGISLSLFASMTVLGVVAIGVSVPASPGFFGVIQASFKLALLPFIQQGLVEDSNVFAASIYYHIVQYIPVTAIGLLFLNLSGFSLFQLGQQAEHEAEETGEEILHPVQNEESDIASDESTTPDENGSGS